MSHMYQLYDTVTTTCSMMKGKICILSVYLWLPLSDYGLCMQFLFFTHNTPTTTCTYCTLYALICCFSWLLYFVYRYSSTTQSDRYWKNLKGGTCVCEKNSVTTGKRGSRKKWKKKRGGYHHILYIPAVYLVYGIQYAECTTSYVPQPEPDPN